MNTELVQFNHANFMKADVVTTSLKVAEVFEKEHRDLLRKIKEMVEELNLQALGGERYFALSYYLSEQNKKQPMYEITHDGFTLLAMGFTGSKFLSFKIAYIKEFNKMKDELSKIHLERIMGIRQRKELTDAIKLNFNAGDKFVFGRITNHCYKKVFGKTATELKSMYGVNHTDKLRDFIDELELNKVSELERDVAVWIKSFNFDEQDIINKLEL